MNLSRVFLKVRAIAFSCISLLSFLWIILLCLMLYYRWDESDHSEHSLLIILLLVNTVTVIMLPVLSILEFRPWLDAARLLLLLVAHLGTAIAFTIWNPSLQCPEHSADQEGVCKLINMYILLASWIIPGLLLVYSVCLAAVVYWKPLRFEPALEINTDEEQKCERQSDHRSRSTSTIADSTSSISQPSRLNFPSQHDLTSGREIADGGCLTDDGGRRSGRLSKPLPARFFE